MGKFSKIFKHIESKDLRNKYEQKKVAKIEEEKKKKEFKQYLVSSMETKKYNWRESMTTSDVSTISVEKAPGDGTVTPVNAIDATSYTGTTGILAPNDDLGANVGTEIRASGTGEGHGGFNVGGNYLAFQGTGSGGLNARFAVLSAVDSTEVDTLQIRAIVGNDSNGGEDPDENGEQLVVMYKTPAMPEAMFLIQRPDGSVPEDITGTEDQIIPLGAAPNAGLNDYSVSIPDYARASGTQFILIQPSNSGVGFDNYGVTEIKFQRRTPLTVVVPLDNPDASSFIRSAPPKSTPKKRKKDVDDKLEASDKYTGAKFGNEFPGREVRVGGEDPFRSAKIGDDVEPSPLTKAGVKKAFGGADLKSALGQPDIKKADPQRKITGIVKSGQVKSQSTPSEPKINLGDFQSKVEQGKTKSAVNSIVNQNVSPTQKLDGLSTVISTVAEKNPEQLPNVIDAVIKSGEEATTEKKNRIVIGLENAKNVVSGAADWAGDTINGVGDAFVVLNQMSKAVSNAYKEGNVQDGKIKEGAPGSLSNPVNTKVSNSTAQDILKGVDLNDIITQGKFTSSTMSQLLDNLADDPISGNMGAKAIHNNLAQSNIDKIRVNENGDLIIPDTYAFRPLGHEEHGLTKAYANIVGVLGGDKEEATKDMATILDQSIGAILNVGQGIFNTMLGTDDSFLTDPLGSAKTGGFVPGRNDPQVEFQTVIPKEQLLEILKRGDKNIPNAEAVIKALENLSSDKKNEILNSMGMNPDADSTLPTNQPSPAGEGKRNSAYYKEQPDKVLPGGIVLKWIPGEVTYKNGDPSLGLADPADWIPGAWTDITEYIPWTNIPASQAKKSGMDVSATTAPGDRNGAQSDETTSTAPNAPKVGDERFNGTTKQLEVFNGNKFVPIPRSQLGPNGYMPKSGVDPYTGEKYETGDTTQPELGYEPTTSSNKRVNEIIGKSMGDIKNVSEADLDFLIKSGYPIDDIFFGGQTLSPISDLIGLGLSAAAIKLALPLLLKAGGSLVTLTKKEWGMRALTDAAYKTFETTGKMPPWYHWAAHKLLPQSVLNTYAKLMGLKSIPQSILPTGGTKAGNIGLLGLGAAAIAKITKLMLQGRNKEADKLVVTEMTKITNKNIDNMSDNEIFKVIGDLDSKKFDDYDKFLESPKVPSSFRSNLKTLDEYAVEYETLSDEMNSLEGDPASFEAYTKNRTEISNEMFKFFSGGKDGYNNNPDLDPRVLIPDPKGLERTDYITFRDSYKPFIKLDKDFQKASEDSRNHYKNKLEPAFDKAESYAKANLTYDASTKMYQGTKAQISTYSKLSKEAMKLSAVQDKLSNKFNDFINKQIAMQDEVQKLVDKENEKYDKAMEKVEAERKKLEDEYQEKYDYYRKIYDERFSYKTTQTFQDKLLKAGEDYTPAPLFGQKAGKTIEGFKSLGLKTKEEYEKELEEITNKSSKLADKMDFVGVDKLFLKELSMRAMNETVKAGGSESFKGDDYKPTKPKPSDRRAEAAKKRGEAEKRRKERDALGSAGEIGGVDATAAATAAAASKKDDDDTLIAGNYPSSFEQQILRNQLNAIQRGQGNAAAKKEQERLMKMYGIHFPLASGGGGNTQLAHFKPRGKNLFERVSKLRKPNEFFNQDDIKPEFPENPPPKLDPKTGMHPEYGKKANRYKKLDPASANAMPLTGDPEIDAVVNKQKTINKIKSMRKKA